MGSYSSYLPVRERKRDGHRMYRIEDEYTQAQVCLLTRRNDIMINERFCSNTMIQDT